MLTTPTSPRLALRGCIYCRAVPYIGDYLPLCNPCNTQLARTGPLILPVPQDHTTYWASEQSIQAAGASGVLTCLTRVVVDQFNTAWAHPTKRPEIRMVYRIVAAPSVWDNYWAYR